MCAMFEAGASRGKAMLTIWEVVDFDPWHRSTRSLFIVLIWWCFWMELSLRICITQIIDYSIAEYHNTYMSPLL
jgi:hypothetical protein